MNRSRAGEGEGGGEGKKNAASNNGVIITVYAENPTKSSTWRAAAHTTKTKRARNAPRGTCGYSRRAQLLVYTRELRNADQDPSQLKPQYSLTAKRRWFALPKRLQVWFDQLFRRRRKNKRWRYERIISEQVEVCDGSEKKVAPPPEPGRGQTRTATFRVTVRKLRSMLKEVSCGCKPRKVL